MLKVTVMPNLTLKFVWQHFNPMRYNKNTKETYDNRVFDAARGKKNFYGTTCRVYINDSKESLAHKNFKDINEGNRVLGKAFLNPKDTFCKATGRKLSLRSLLGILTNSPYLLDNFKLSKKQKREVWIKYSQDIEGIPVK